MKAIQILIIVFLGNLSLGLQAQSIVKIPFDGHEYKTDTEHFRARQSGTSPRVDIAKKMAMLNAKGELARSIEAVLKSVTEQYINQTQTGDNIQINSKFQEQIREVAEQTLTNTRLAGEKTLFDKKKGLYTVWVVVEADAKSVSQDLIEKLEDNQETQFKIDKKRFEKIFEQEMNNLK